MKVKLLIGIMFCALAQACADSESDGGVSLRGLCVGFSDNGWTRNPVSRAATPPVAPESALPATLGVYAYNSNAAASTVFANQQMFYTEVLPEQGRWPLLSDGERWKANNAGNTWIYAPERYWLPTEDYKFFAYAPYRDAGTATNDTTLNGFLRFEWTDIPEFSSDDHTVATAIATVSGGTSPNVRLRHIMSRVRFCFTVGADYSALRDIYIKEVSVTRTPTRYTYAVDFYADGSERESASTQTDIPTGAPTDVCALNIENAVTAGVLLEPDKYKPAASLYVLPVAGMEGRQLENVPIVVTYDVYDKAGVRTRKDQTTRATLTATWTLSEGYYYDALIMVNPDYLYVLSDNDADIVMKVE